MHQDLRPIGIRHLVIAIVLPLGIWLATIVLACFDPAAGDIDIAAGSVTFRDRCGACHILDKGITLQHGPNFYDIGKVAATRKPGLTAAEYILESILDPHAFVAPENWKGMPKNVTRDLTSEEIRNVVAFLASRGARPDYNEIRRLEIPQQPEPPLRIVRRDDMELAEHVMRERAGCLHCHSIYRSAEHQVFAPGLFAVGLVDKQAVRDSILDPNKEVLPAHFGVKVLLKNGKVVTGKLISQNDDRLVMLVRDEENRPARTEVAMSDIEEEDGQLLIVSSELSPMPTGFDQLLTPEELGALVAMIGQLN